MVFSLTRHPIVLPHHSSLPSHSIPRFLIQRLGDFPSTLSSLALSGLMLHCFGLDPARIKHGRERGWPYLHCLCLRFEYLFPVLVAIESCQLLGLPSVASIICNCIRASSRIHAKVPSYSCSPARALIKCGHL